MGDKYKVKKSALKALFATAEMIMENNYHELFQRLGLRQGSNKNFHCVNEDAHSRGTDATPSMSVSNQNGQWHCFTCGIKGNFNSYWKEYLSHEHPSYTDFLIDFLDLNTSEFMNFNAKDDEDLERNTKELKLLYTQLQDERLEKKGRPWILQGELTEMIKKLSTIEMAWLDQAVEDLLNCPEDVDYLYQTRRITEDVIKKYRLGRYYHDRSRRWKYVFPTINAEGDFINAKAYDPRSENPEFKWMHIFSGHEFGPVPINNFTQQKLYFFEGEPDLYCAISFGIEGAVSFGPMGKTDAVDVFGIDLAKQIFSGKEIVICFDAEEEAQANANKLAVSLYPFAKQIKILNLGISSINPKGLDETLTHKITYKKYKTQQVVEKIKRTEKDFTDFMKKNGFDENARKEFDAMVERTPVFVHDSERLKKKTSKVTLRESRMARYYSSKRTKELELIASVSDFNCNAYMYPTEFTASCRLTEDKSKAIGGCKTCKIGDLVSEDHPSCSENGITFKIVREKTKEQLLDPTCVELIDHNILGLIEVTDKQKNQHLKKVCGISENCRFCMISDGVPEKLLHVRLAKDLNEYREDKGEAAEIGASADIDVEAYIQGDADIYPNRSYKFLATQTTAWNGQHAVLYIHKSKPIETSVESFKMNQDVHDILTIFKPRPGESIEDHLERRYTVFSNAVGVTGRKELFFINDLAYFSPIEIKNKMLPEVKRGWVEVLIAGDPRTCKTMISKFLHRHYKVGEVVAGSSGVSRAGLIGGVTYFKNKPQLSWGKVPMNDNGIIIIDEMSEIDVGVLTDLTDIRSEGVADITMVKSGKVSARTRKIMLSNPRPWKGEDEKEYNYGIQFLRDLCLQDRVLARFDIGFVVRRGDVDINEFESKYSEITTEFNEFQCRNLIMWAYSRKPEDIEFEKGFNEYVNKINIQMNEKFHSSTQLVNQERAKLVRLSVSLATMLYSTPEDDWNKILVTKKHLDYIVKFLDDLYCHPNMKMDQYSKMKKESEKIGNMNFMANICEHIDVRPLFREEEFNEKGLQQIFYDYLQKVEKNEMYIPDAKSDKLLSQGLRVYEGNQKLLGVLTARNCLVRTKRGTFKKTTMFNNWLEERIELGDKADKSYLLELKQNEPNFNAIEEVKKRQQNRKRPKDGTDS